MITKAMVVTTAMITITFSPESLSSTAQHHDDDNDNDENDNEDDGYYDDDDHENLLTWEPAEDTDMTDTGL